MRTDTTLWADMQPRLRCIIVTQLVKRGFHTPTYLRITKITQSWRQVLGRNLIILTTYPSFLVVEKCCSGVRVLRIRHTI